MIEYDDDTDDADEAVVIAVILNRAAPSIRKHLRKLRSQRRRVDDYCVVVSSDRETDEELFFSVGVEPRTEYARTYGLLMADIAMQILKPVVKGCVRVVVVLESTVTVHDLPLTSGSTVVPPINARGGKA